MQAPFARSPQIPKPLMSQPLRKTHPLLRVINASLIDLPAPCNLSVWWNFGSLLGLCLILQTLTGLLLAIHYTPHTDFAFFSVAHIARDVNNGWLLRSLHANGAALFFACMYIHIGRGIYYGSYLLIETWIVGVLLFILTIATAFIGYVLPWGQIRFWAATVITNFLSAIPYIGANLVKWVWGGFAVSNATLVRFFALHFLLPFILILLTVIHFVFLHETGSNNPLGLESDHSLIPFHPFYTAKDILGFIIAITILATIVIFMPYLFTEPENYIPANPLSTPPHIKPEWYFLWAYTILRSIPNKLGGVAAIFAAILILFSLPFTHLQARQGNQFYPVTQILFWSLATTTALLTWIGAKPVEDPYEVIGQYLTLTYFILYFALPASAYTWDILLDTET